MSEQEYVEWSRVYFASDERARDEADRAEMEAS